MFTLHGLSIKGSSTWLTFSTGIKGDYVICVQLCGWLLTVGRLDLGFLNSCVKRHMWPESEFTLCLIWLSSECGQKYLKNFLLAQDDANANFSALELFLFQISHFSSF